MTDTSSAGPRGANERAATDRGATGRTATRRAGTGLTARIFVALGAVVAAVLAAALVLVTAAAERAADAVSAGALDRTTRLVGVLLDGREQSLARAAQVFVLNPTFRSLVITAPPEDMRDQAEEAAERTGATWVQIVDTTGTRIAKSDEPAAPRASLLSSALISGALGGDVTAGYGIAGDTALVQAVAVPIVPTFQVAGALMAAQVVDSALAAEVRRTTESEVVFWVADRDGAPRIVASSLGRDSALVAELTPTLREALPADSSDAGADTAARPAVELELAGTHWVGRSVPLRSAGGEVLGGFLSLRDRDAALAPYTTLRRWILVAGVLGIAIAFALSWLIARSIADPVLSLERATRRAAHGDYGADVTVRTNDEIGSLADAVRAMLVDLREKQSLLDVLRESREHPTMAPFPAAAARARAAAGVGDSGRAYAPPPGTSGSPSADDGEIAPGRLLANRYEIAEVLGAGGAGVVYRALDRELGEPVAIKTIRPEMLAHDDSALERLKSEIRLARRISHRNVVRTHDIGEAGGTYFLTMEYVTGTTLDTLLERQGRLPVAATLAIAKQMCRALEVAHEEGIVHRDIKPPNLMVQPDGLLKVMDFGVARLVERTGGLTQVGLVVGTPAYMAPEQLLDEPVDARADLYAMGVVLYECLTGRRPIEADTPAALVGRLLSVTPAAPGALVPDVPPVLSDLVMRLLAKDPAMRPPSAAAAYELLIAVEE